MANDPGSLEHVREHVDGHPMSNLLRYCLPYWPRLTVGVLAATTTRVARLIPALLVAAAIDRVILPGESEPGLLADLGLLTSEPIAGTAQRLSLLRHLVIIAGIAYVLRSVARFLSRYLFQSTAQKVQRDLRDEAYAHMQRLSMTFFANHQTGGLMSVLSSDVNRLEEFLNTEIRQIIRVVATVGGIAAVMFYVSPKLALIALAPVPIIGVASGKFLGWIEPRYRGIRESVARLNSRLENNLGGAKVIKSFNRHAFERDRVAAQSQQYHDEKVGAIRLRRGFFAGLRLLTGVVFVALLWVAGRDVIRFGAGVGPALSAGSVALFFLLLRRLYSPMRRIGKTANKYQLAQSSAERVFGVLGREPAVQSPDDPYDPDSVAGDVAFEDVRFGYTAEETVLDGVSLDVEAGETVGLAGATGAGKSTLLKLVARFYDVDEGRVAVDGTDVREWDLRTLREHVGVVEQNPYLFSGTVAENVAYGDLRALHDDGSPTERLVEAAKAAEAHEFVADLPDGYRTQVGERGVKLSGGQRQRLAIARALLNDPEVVVLDEATSDVDTETEERIQESLDRLTADRTAFVIAHRLSTIRDADRIVVMDDGRIVERGAHADLVATGGTYATLWRGQAGDADGDGENRPDAAVADDD